MNPENPVTAQPLLHRGVAQAVTGHAKAVTRPCHASRWQGHLAEGRTAMKKSPPEITKPFYAAKLEAAPAELEKQREAQIERMIEAKVAQALHRLGR